MPRQRPVRFAGHPLHPALAHLPIGTWAAAAVWDGVALLTGEPLWWQMAYWSLALGLASALPAAAIGFVDFLAIDSEGPAEAAARYHLTAVLSAATVYFASLLIRAGPAPPTKPAIAVSLAGIALVLLIGGGWFGAELVYRHRVGTREPRDR